MATFCPMAMMMMVVGAMDALRGALGATAGISSRTRSATGSALAPSVALGSGCATQEASVASAVANGTSGQVVT